MVRFKEYGNSFRRIVSAIVLLFILLIVTGEMGEQKFFFPLFTYAEEKESGIVHSSLSGVLLLYEYGSGNVQETAYIVEEPEREKVVIANVQEREDDEGSRSDVETENMQSASGESFAEAQISEELTLQELMLQENQTGMFMPAEKVMSYDMTLYEDYENLLSTFYTIDRYALAGSDLFNLKSLLEKDLTLEKGAEGPQILIYHTHSREAFSDSVPGDSSQTIVGVGDFLAQILTEEYGYNVLHHTVEYDTVRDDAYAKSLPGLEAVLAEYPSIQVVIDLHRDAGNPTREMVVDINGRPTARFMFFNGISRSTSTGNIDYLYNPNLSANLAFSFQMQKVAGEYYPGLTRKIYIKQYRYNMHLRERTLLIELGDENNTVEEAMNACYPLAHILHLVLSGEAQ
ncbi:MAG: stage II sporulation protein P [Lachnospiraceae bacterium]